MRNLVLACLVACGGGGQQARPAATVTDVDQVLAVKPVPRDIPAPADLTLTPWRVGQWALYRMVSKSAVGYMRYRALAEDTCGLWFEQTITDPQRQVVIKLCLRSPPDLTTVTQATVQLDGGEPAAMNPVPRDSSLPGAGWDQQADAPREDVVVPAGRFAGAVKTTTKLKGVVTTVWSHPAVPLAGTVKTTAANGVTTELFDFGER